MKTAKVIKKGQQMRELFQVELVSLHCFVLWVLVILQLAAVLITF